jgi:glutamate formiminotransferase
MNLTDFEQTPIHRVLEAVQAEAARYGVSIAGTEIIGLVPSKALATCEGVDPDQILENRLRGS